MVMNAPEALTRWSRTDYNSYAEDQELTGKNANLIGDSVTEKSITVCKLLVQAGNKADEVYSQRTGSKLEIVPLQNPNKLVTGDRLSCLLLLDGKPFPHTLVRVWNRVNRTSFQQNLYTENDGTITFPISIKGAWMVSATAIDRSIRDGDVHTVKSTFVFGI